MEVKKIWKTQFIIGWIVLTLLLMGGGFLLSTGKAAVGLVLIGAGIVIELVSSVLMMSNYRCPKCGAPLNRHAVRPAPGMVICPHCNANIREV